MAIIPIIIKSLPAFSDRKIIIITPGCPYIKKIGPSFPGANPFAVNTLRLLFIILVRHFYKILAVKELVWYQYFTNIEMFLNQPNRL